MIWRKRYIDRVLKPVAGLLLAFFMIEATQFLPFQSLVPLWNVAEAANAFIDPAADGTVVDGAPDT